MSSRMSALLLTCRVCLCRAQLLKLEEEYIQTLCQDIAKHKPDVVVTEKGLSDLAMHFLTKAGISAIRRLRKTDNNRIARACGATIVHRQASLSSCHRILLTPISGLTQQRPCQCKCAQKLHGTICNEPWLCSPAEAGRCAPCGDPQAFITDIMLVSLSRV